MVKQRVTLKRQIRVGPNMDLIKPRDDLNENKIKFIGWYRDIMKS